MRQWPLLWRYLLIRPSMSSYGVWSIATEVFVQAFGRNDVPEDRLHRIVDEHRRWDYDDFATINALHAWFDPGQPNRELARALAYLLSYRPHLVAYVQWEVAVAMRPSDIESCADRLRIIWPPSNGDDFDSIKVIDRAIELGFGRHAPTVMVLAHRQMLIRLIYMVRRRLNRTFVGGMSGATGFDPRSVQSHTATAWCWYLREAIDRWTIFPFRRLV